MPASTTGPTELRALLNSSASLPMIDVRTPGEFETAHILGAHNVPLEFLREHGAAIGGGLTRAALSDTCAMGLLLAKLPDNRGPSRNLQAIVDALVARNGVR